MYMKIAIIGFGWLGKPLAIALKELGHDIVGTTTSNEKKTLLETENLKAHCWNSREQDFIFNENFQDVDIVVINFPPGRQTDVTTYGESIRKIVTSFPSSTKFIFVSSTSVYPDQVIEFKEEDVDLDTRARDNNIAYAEWVLKSLLQDENLTIIRMAGLIGGDRHPAKFFAGRNDISNGNQPVNLIFRKDAVNLIVQCIEQQFWGEIINGCSSIHPSKSEYYTFACSQFNFELPSFLNSEGGKLISNEKSKIKLNFSYEMDNPMDYWSINL